ncbi:hypothetical protein BCR35DRAFT_352482, partial [Leucosporidium creatinivorum]
VCFASTRCSGLYHRSKAHTTSRKARYTLVSRTPSPTTSSARQQGSWSFARWTERWKLLQALKGKLKLPPWPTRALLLPLPLLQPSPAFASFPSRTKSSASHLATCYHDRSRITFGTVAAPPTSLGAASSRRLSENWRCQSSF